MAARLRKPVELTLAEKAQACLRRVFYLKEDYATLGDDLRGCKRAKTRDGYLLDYAESLRDLASDIRELERAPTATAKAVEAAKAALLAAKALHVEAQRAKKAAPKARAALRGLQAQHDALLAEFPLAPTPSSQNKQPSRGR